MLQVCFAVRVYCTTVALAAVPLLVANPARAQSTSAADRAAAVGVATGSVQPAPVTRQWCNDWFRDRDYFDPLIAEPRAPQIAFTFPAWIPELEFSVEPGNRLAWEVSTGLVNPSNGYYSDHTLMFPEESRRDVFKSKRNFEPCVVRVLRATPHQERGRSGGSK